MKYMRYGFGNDAFKKENPATQGSAVFSSVVFSSLWPTAVTGSLVLLTVLVQVGLGETGRQGA